MAKSQEALRKEYLVKLKRNRAKKIKLYTDDPANFIFSGDVFTKDEHDLENSVKPMPDKPYLRKIVSAIQDPEKVIFIPKSRQIMMSWIVCAYCLAIAMFKQNPFILIQSKEAQAAFDLVYNHDDMLQGRISFMYYYLPDYLKQWNPVSATQGNLIFKTTGAKIRGVAEGRDKVRSNVPTILFADEATIQPQFEEAYAAALACCQKIIAVGTANPGFFADVVEG